MLIEITSSSPRSRMPCTPEASRPIARTSFSWKRIAWPARETISTSSSPDGVADADELVALAHLDRDDPVRLERRVVRLELRLLDDAVLRREDEVLGLLEVARLDHRAHLLVLAERQQVDDRAALRLARPERQLVHLQPVDLADAREEEDVVVRRGDEEVLDVVLVLEVHAHDADAAAPLLAIRGHRQALDVAGARDRDHHVLLRDQVLELELVLGGDDLGAAVVVAAVDLLDLEQLLLDQRRRSRAGSPRIARSSRDPLLQVGVLVLDLLAREPGEAREAAGRGSPAPGSRRASNCSIEPGARGRRCPRRRGSARSPRRGCRARSGSPRGCARALSALRSSYFERRVTTSRW